MSDAEATQARRDVVADVDEIIEHVINANMLSMPYDVYSELFDAVDGLGVEIENLQSENAKLREERDYYKALWEHATATDCELRRVRTAWKEDRKQNAKLRQIAARMWPMATRAKRCTFADRLKLRAEIDELGIEVEE